MRSALGAGRGRLARLALTESLLLAAAGGGRGLVVAKGLLEVFVSLAPSSIPKIEQASFDLRVFAVTAALALVAGLATGLWPAITLLRARRPVHGQRMVGAVRPRVQFALVTAEIALTLAMLSVSTLMLRSLWNLVHVPLGFESERVLTMNTTLNLARYPNLERQYALLEELLERLQQIPGTVAATLSNAPAPLGIALTMPTMPVDGEPWEIVPGGPTMRLREATPGYFETFRIPVLAGRAFVPSDRAAAQPVAVLSTAAERILFPVQSGVGHTIRLQSNGPWHMVVGVVEDVRNLGLTEAPQPEVYVVRPATPGVFDRYGNFAIRTTATPADAAAFLRQTVADLDPELPVEIRTLDDVVRALSERPRFVSGLLVAFAGLGILLPLPVCTASPRTWWHSAHATSACGWPWVQHRPTWRGRSSERRECGSWWGACREARWHGPALGPSNRSFTGWGPRILFPGPSRSSCSAWRSWPPSCDPPSAPRVSIRMRLCGPTELKI